MTGRRDIPDLALISLLAVQVAYAGFWAAHDISARLGLWADPVQAEAFILSLSLTQEILFFSHVILNVIALVLVLLRRGIALPVFILSFACDRIEWVIMGSNNLFSMMVDVDSWALFSFTLQGAIIALLVFMRFEGRLR